MRAIVGVQIVEAGEVRVLGVPAGSPELRSRVGYVTQAPSVYADLTVRENLRYFARVLGVPAARVDDTIATVGLGGQEGQVVRTLSGGERSRVSLATALLGEPDVLVLDEPTVGLDPVLRRDLWDTLPRARRRRGGAPRLVARDGRGRALRRARAHAGGPRRRRGRACGPARADRRRRPRGRVPRPRGGPVSLRDHPRDGRAGARAAAPRPPHARARPPRPVAAVDALPLRLRRPARDVRPRRRADGRDLPARLDVPRHVDRDAPRAHQRDARAAHVAAAGEARPAARLRARLRARRRRAGVARLRRRLRAARARRGGLGRARRRPRGRERRARDGARPLPLRLRLDGVPGRAVHAGGDPAPAPALRPARPARPDGAGAGLDLLRPPDDVRLRRARARHVGDAGPELALDVAVVIGSIVVALALGAATLRRRTP